MISELTELAADLPLSLAGTGDRSREGEGNEREDGGIKERESLGWKRRRKAHQITEQNIGLRE